MKTTRETVTRATAEGLAYRPLTTGYTSGEEWMLENAIADLERGGRSYLLVQERRNGPVEIYVGYEHHLPPDRSHHPLGAHHEVLSPE